jgi:uncharacterized membrane protein YiaA
MKNLLWDAADQTIRGSFINMIVTLVTLSLICVGCFNTSVAANLDKMSTLILGFFGISFGVWAAKSVKGKSNVDCSTKDS